MSSMPCMKNATHSEIWQAWEGRALKAGYSPHEAAAIHRHWKSIGSKVAKLAKIK